MDTKKVTELTVPLSIGILVVLIGGIVASELLVLGMFLSFPAIMIGLGVGLLTLPVYRGTGVSYAPRAYDRSNGFENQILSVDRPHVLFSVYYSYLSALLGLVIGISDYHLSNYSPLSIGVIAGLSVGFLFFVAHQINTRRGPDHLSLKATVVSALLGFLLVFPGYSWWFFIGMLDV